MLFKSKNISENNIPAGESQPPPAQVLNSSAPAPQPAMPPPAPPATVSAPAQPPAPKKRRLKGIAIVTLVALALCGSLLIAIKNINNKDDQGAQPVKKAIPLLKVGLTQAFPAEAYPHDQLNIYDAQIDSQIYEGLTKYENGNQVVPGLAESWSNPNNTTWEFKLQTGIKFHDGHPLTAQAVKASLEDIATTDWGETYGTSIKSIIAEDSQTVRIVTNEPDYFLPNELANLWIYDTAAPSDQATLNGTGPYFLKPGTKLNPNTIDLVAKEDYYDGTPLVKEIIFKYYIDYKAMANDVKNKRLDIADMPSLEEMNAAKQYGYGSYIQQTPLVYLLLPNSLRAGSPLQNLKVRQAIYEALDPQAILKIDGHNGIVATQFVPQVIPGFNPVIQRPKLDPVKAKADLAAAGYPNGFTLKFTYFKPRQNIAEEIQKELAAIGVKLTLDPENDYGSVTLKGQTDLSYIGYGSDYISTSDVIQALLIDSANYKNPAVDDQYEKAISTLSPQERLTDLQQLNKLVMDDVAGMPLFVPSGAYFSARSDLVLHSDNLTEYIGVDFWKVYSNGRN